jgi:hypothetical protein
MRPNGENWSMEKFENFCLQKWIFAVTNFHHLASNFFFFKYSEIRSLKIISKTKKGENNVPRALCRGNFM